MPGKSRHSPGGHSSRSKKKKGRLSPKGIVAQPPAVTTAYEPKPPTEPPKKAAPAMIPTVRYPYILTELRRIGILAGIILAILIVLALVW